MLNLERKNMHLRTLWNLTRKNYTHELHRSYLEHFIDSKHNDQRNHHLTFCSNKLSRTPWKHQSEVDFLKCRISTRYIVIHHKSLKSASWLLARYCDHNLQLTPFLCHFECRKSTSEASTAKNSLIPNDIKLMISCSKVFEQRIL